jgi:REP element-mobilizing transposase RayT
MRRDNFIPPQPSFLIRSRGRLPHWELDDATYFITFRLKDSLPLDVVRRLRSERQRLIRTATNPAERAEIDRLFFNEFDGELDRGGGSCFLSEHAGVIADALRFFDGSRYELLAWCVMPNHVHVLIHLMRGSDLSRVVHSWKSYTSHQIGKGEIWQAEYFDRIVRDARELRRVIRYVRGNPTKAGLRDWPWVG